MKKIAILASGRGSNAQKIIDFFRKKKECEITLILTNKSTAGIIDIARSENIAHQVLDRSTFKNADEVIELLQENSIDLVVLAGFLWLIPEKLVKAFSNRIVNIHPALLPKYGGKGMYGMHVHKAVKLAGEKQSGITIHYVNEQYDEGAIIFQAACELKPSDSAEEIAKKVLFLEHKFYPLVIAQLLNIPVTQ